MPGRKFSEEEFNQNVDSTFQADLEKGSVVDLKLIKVQPYSFEPHRPDMQRFSLIFSGPPDVSLPQNMYSLKHERMGQFNIFLVPIAGDETGYRYEAVFNFFKTPK